MQHHCQRPLGFSFVEFLVVAAIITFLVGVLMIGFQNYAGYQRYNQAVADVQFILNQTRIDARSAVGDVAHGIKFGVSTTTQFIGGVYSVSDPDNVETAYQLVTFETNLTGGTNEIIFDKLSGIPSATGTVVVTGTAFSASTTITISDTGVIE